MPLDFQVSTKGVISDNDTILILKGNSKKFRQTCWDLPGGRMEPGETLSETLKREVEEELPGANVTKIGQLFYAEANHHLVDNRELLTLFYFISIKVDRLQLSAEHEAFLWIDQKNLSTLEQTTGTPLLTDHINALTKAFASFDE